MQKCVSLSRTKQNHTDIFQPDVEKGGDIVIRYSLE